MKHNYVHGYSEKEYIRLTDQAHTLTELLHCDSVYPEGSLVLEVGCGIGAQTITLASRNLQTSFISMDISRESLNQAEVRIHEMGLKNVNFLQADIFDLPFATSYFDHVFVCFVLEHLSNVPDALNQIKRVLKPGGSITVIEGDHGSAYFHPDSSYAQKAIQCLVDLQRLAGGDSNIGRRLFSLLVENGFQDVHVSPRMVYADGNKPEMQDGFTRKTFTAMVEGVSKEAIFKGMMDEKSWKKGVLDLYRTAKPDGSFCYTFFKAVGRNGKI